PTGSPGQTRRWLDRSQAQARRAVRRSAPPRRSTPAAAQRRRVLVWASVCRSMPKTPGGVTNARAGPGHYHTFGRFAPGAGSPRSSASPTPEQAPLPLPLQDPAPLAPASRPLPVADLSPALTVTTTAPFLATLPLMLMGADPPLPRLPLLMRTG